MGLKLDEELMSKMTIQERFNYIAAKKKMLEEIRVIKDIWCNYSDLPSPKAYEQNTDDEWVDRDENEYDSSSGGDKLKRRGGEYNDVGDDSNEY
tara:strand:+ start:301 stop:582 length:282 start_codon:yes stop_codon:yes gene_type:complete